MEGGYGGWIWRVDMGGWKWRVEMESGSLGEVDRAEIHKYLLFEKSTYLDVQLQNHPLLLAKDEPTPPPTPPPLQKHC